MRKFIGMALIASPFIALTVVLVKLGGWQAAAFVWGVTLAILAVIAASTYLIDGEL